MRSAATQAMRSAQAQAHAHRTSHHHPHHHEATSHTAAPFFSQPTTAAASRTSNTEEHPLLLRSWLDNSTTSTTSVQMAPAAAVVVEAIDRGDDEYDNTHGGGITRHHLNDNVGGVVGARGSSSNLYPVATFVRDLVRNGMDHMAHSSSSSLALQQLSASSATRNGPGNFRSDPNIVVDAEAAAAEATSLTVRTLNDLDFTADAEFILVDGDLVAIPPPPPNAAEQEGYEDMLRDSQKTCQPTKFRQGVRKFNRLFKRNPRHKFGGSGGLGGRSSSISSDAGGSSISATAATTAASSSIAVLPTAVSETTSTISNNETRPTRRCLLVAHTGLSTPAGIVDGTAAAATVDAAALSSAALSTAPTLTAGAAPPPPPVAGITTTTSEKPTKRAPRVGMGALKHHKRLGGSIRWGQGRGGGGGTGGEDPLLQQKQVPANFAADPLLQSQEPLQRRSSTTPPRGRGGIAVALLRPATTGVATAASAAASVSSMSSAATAASMPRPTPLMFDDNNESSNETHRTQSVTASLVGTVDQLMVAGVLPAGIAAEAYVEYYEDINDTANCGGGSLKKDDGSLVPSLVPWNAYTDSIKVDKSDDAPDVDTMLRRAALETINQDLLDSSITSSEGNSALFRPSSYFLHRGKSLEEDRVASLSSASSSPQIIPLSLSCEKHHHSTDGGFVVVNDTLKVIMVGCLLEKTWLARAIRQQNYLGSPQKPPRKRTSLHVDVHTWAPPTACTTTLSDQHHQQEGGNGISSSHSSSSAVHNTSLPIKFQIWDTQGATSTIDGTPNFGGHPSTQSLFFSAQSLYILVWDLAASNPKTYHYTNPKKQQQGTNTTKTATSADDSEDDDDDDDDDEGDFVREEANRQADRVLQADIRKQVLSWVEWIARRGVGKSAILPVAVMPLEQESNVLMKMDEEEVTRRCSMMQDMLEQHVQRFVMRVASPSNNKNAVPVPKLLTGAEGVLRVGYGGFGLDQLRETLIAIATDASKSVFEHVGSPVPDGTAVVLEACRRLKVDHKLVLVDHLMFEIGSLLSFDQVIEALHFLASTGEMMYFGSLDDEILSHYIVLNRRWLNSAISCILRNDLKRELVEARRFMNMQCLYSDQRYEENEIARALAGATTSSVPLLSDLDAKMLWQSSSFMMEAANRSADLGDSPATAPTLFTFLERLLVSTGILVPVACSHSSLDRSKVFFVPSLLPQVDPREIWTYRTSESWMTTLCHSWLFRDGAPSGLMEDITVAVLRDLYEFSRSFQGSLERSQPSHVTTFPLSSLALHDFCEDHNDQPIGRFRIHQVICWQTSVLVKVGTIFPDPHTNDLRESFVEVLITMVDQSSDTCVASDAMRSGMHRIIVSAKGQVGHHGRKIWKGGYKVILDSVGKTLKSYANVDSQVVCPECLAHLHPHNASTWSLDSVQAAAEAGSAIVRCMRGHRVDTNLIGGTHMEVLKAPPDDAGPLARHAKPVAEILPSVVLVGLWDPETKKIESVGSGFVVDRKLGLVVTAAHVLFTWDAGPTFGTPYFGRKDAKVVIGILEDGSRKAAFRYFGEIVCGDVQHVDACVVRITTRMENDVDDEGTGCADQPENSLDSSDLQNEQLRTLKLAKRFDLEEPVRILGFNQGGEGVLKPGMHVNRNADVAKGYICGEFKVPASDDSSSSSHSSDSDAQLAFVPREEIVIMCPTIPGHSGGPCVNEEGKVVGILSRADPVSRLRCYLVPYSELRTLMKKARKLCSHPENSTVLIH